MNAATIADAELTLYKQDPTLKTEEVKWNIQLPFDLVEIELAKVNAAINLDSWLFVHSSSI